MNRDKAKVEKKAVELKGIPVGRVEKKAYLYIFDTFSCYEINQMLYIPVPALLWSRIACPTCSRRCFP
jgi:hypothetical protein